MDTQSDPRQQWSEPHSAKAHGNGNERTCKFAIIISFSYRGSKVDPSILNTTLLQTRSDSCFMS